MNCDVYDGVYLRHLESLSATRCGRKDGLRTIMIREWCCEPRRDGTCQQGVALIPLIRTDPLGGGYEHA